MFEFFSGFDHSVASAVHGFATATGGNLNRFFYFFSLLGFKALPIFFAAIVLMLFRKTRKTGTTAFIAIAIGAIITNLILKNVVFRARPFADITSDYHVWWEYAGAVAQDGSSFPSGHSTASMAFALAFFLTTNKKYSWAIFFFPLVMGLSRIYLNVHYASDVLFGFISGAVGATISFFLTDFIYKLMLKKPDVKLFRFYFDFTITAPFTKKEKEPTDEEQN